MDWIEELFGISPDAGSGTLEATIAAAVVLVVLGVVFGAARTRREEAAPPTEGATPPQPASFMNSIAPAIGR